jgi:alpha-N-arabinofuranosidase
LVKIANLAQLVNAIAPIVTSPDGLFLQSIYHPLRLFADHLGETALDVFVEADTHQLSQSAEPDPWPYRVADAGPFPVLDAVATYTPGSGQLMLSVINRDPVNDVSAEIRIANSLRRQDVAVEELNSDAIDATNSFAAPDRVSVSAGTIEKFGDGATYTFPAHSLTVLTMPCVPE